MQTSPLKRSLRNTLFSYASKGLIALGCGGGLGLAIGSWQHRADTPAISSPIKGDAISADADMLWIHGGEFTMGSHAPSAQPNERPAHKVKLHGFWMDRTPVTNAQFATFVDATGYRTTAERPPDWHSLKAQLPPDTPKPADEALVPGGTVFVGTHQPVDLTDFTQWWRYIPGADWRHPEGPGSSVSGKDDFPVVQVSYEDVLAYAHWAGKRLPTEAEWEYAARGGLEQNIYAWGNDLAPKGKSMANIWEGSALPFPVVDLQSPDAHGPSQVCTFPPNGYGLCDMAGNVWQWAADWYRADAFTLEARGSESLDPQGPRSSYDPDESGAPANAPKRVTRGGSFLCNQSYCMGYRVSARQGSDPDSGTSHIGFRLVSSSQRSASSRDTK